MARSKGSISANLNAFLDALAWAEGTNTSPVTKNDGYDVIVSGLDGYEIFTDYSTHPFANGRPSKKINNRGLTSNASGRYQFMLKDYAHYRNQLKLADFGPLSQDKWAIQLIKETGAIPLIEKGDIAGAVLKVKHLWASLPGAGYGQQERKFVDFTRVYLQNGGKLWSTSTESLEALSPLPLPTLPVVESPALKPNPTPAPVEQPKKQIGLLTLLLNLLKRK